MQHVELATRHDEFTFTKFKFIRPVLRYPIPLAATL
jgi:hypothetical protein